MGITKANTGPHFKVASSQKHVSNHQNIHFAGDSKPGCTVESPWGLKNDQCLSLLLTHEDRISGVEAQVISMSSSWPKGVHHRPNLRDCSSWWTSLKWKTWLLLVIWYIFFFYPHQTWLWKKISNILKSQGYHNTILS